MSAEMVVLVAALLITSAPLWMMAAAMLDRWSMDRTEELIHEAVFEYEFRLWLSGPFFSHFVGKSAEMAFQPPYKLTFTTNASPRLES